MEILEFLREHVEQSGELKLVSTGVVKAANETFGTPLREIEVLALKNGMVPSRYQRNIGTIGIDGQIKLLMSKVAVLGCGGLGGYVIELLARMGIGCLVLIDGDVFDENNLNRQLIATEGNLGKPKAKEAALRVKAINSAVDTEVYAGFAGAENINALLSGCAVAVDALDNVSSRFIMESACRDLGIPMVHGAIAGFVGQVLTILPSDPGLKAVYGAPGNAPDRGVEMELGNPAATPSIVASWQVQETVKVILNIGTPLSRRLLYIDSLQGMVHIINLQG
jgi:molybdopterin/thiamine biosynthesis adenylyltransferase